MEFLKNNRRFDFLYGGKPFAELQFEITQEESGNTLTTEYMLLDGLKVTNVATKYGDSYEWVNWFENTSEQPTEIISELWDASVTLPIAHEEPLAWTAYQRNIEDVTVVYNPTGSTWRYDEFNSCVDQVDNHMFIGHLPPHFTKTYTASGGRSSEENAPFFNVYKSGEGYMFAIGWSGQWNCSVSRTENELTIQTKIEDTHFRILPGERIRTSSFVLMPYKGSVAESHNKWRKLVKENFSIIGQKGRDEHAPLCAIIWGGMQTEDVLDRIETIRKNQLPFEYIWMDAGWYGADTSPSPDEFEGDWGKHTGDWRVSSLVHPDGLKIIADAIHEAGMKYVLWFEMERAQCTTPIVEQHPEYFLFPDKEGVTDVLLNLGYEDAWNYCYNTIANMIEEVGIDCYRQDFNMSPLPYWRKNDEDDRKGISEIKHINGMYRLWDALLERFPHLLIDNCASGGRRIDIETLRRSMPLTRSDYQCGANHLTEGTQCHHLNYNLWMPFSGCGTGRVYDTYRIRSAYSPTLRADYAFSKREVFGKDAEKMNWLKEHLEEYLKIRPYMSEDFYPLTQVSDRTDVWCAAQFDRPLYNDGIVQVFRREKSPYETACFTLYGIDKTCDYIFMDADDNSEIIISGSKLVERGFEVTLENKRSSKIYFYKRR